MCPGSADDRQTEFALAGDPVERNQRVGFGLPVEVGGWVEVHAPQVTVALESADGA